MKASIEYDKLKDLILNCPNKDLQALLAFQYALATRVGEIVPYKHKAGHYIKRKGKPNEEVIEFPTYETQGLTKQCFVEKESHWEIDCPNFKQKSKGKPKFKKGFILKNSQEDWLLEICLTRFNDSSTDILFPEWNENKARRKIREYFNQLGIDVLAQKKYSSHNLRDSRANHLMDFGFDIRDVAKTLGHADIKSASHYLDSRVDKRVDKLREKIGK